VQALHPSQKFNLLPFKMVEAMINYGAEITFTGMTSMLNFMKIYQLVQKRQTDW
jgi:hypothetical protein